MESFLNKFLVLVASLCVVSWTLFGDDVEATYYDGRLVGYGGAGYAVASDTVESVPLCQTGEILAVFTYNNAYFEYTSPYAYAWERCMASATIVNATHVHIFGAGVLRNGECTRIYCEGHIPNFFYFDIGAVWNVSTPMIE
jgi:hypothetical protein